VVPCRHLCTFATSSAAYGTCANPTSLPASGQPCAAQAYTYGSGYQSYYSSTCAGSPVYADYSYKLMGQNFTFLACQCMTQVGLNGSCLDSSACTTGTCNGASFTGAMPTRGTCAAPLANAAMCQQDSECQSGNCQYDNTGNATCQPAIVCP